MFKSGIAPETPKSPLGLEQNKAVRSHPYYFTQGKNVKRLKNSLAEN